MIKKLLSSSIIFLVINFVLIHYSYRLESMYYDYKNPATVENPELSDKNLKEETYELESIDKNDQCTILNCSTTKTIKFKNIDKNFLLYNRDSNIQMNELLNQLAKAQNLLQISFYKYKGLKCIHSARILNSNIVVLDYSIHYHSSFNFSYNPSPCARSNVGFIEKK